MERASVPTRCLGSSSNPRILSLPVFARSFCLIEGARISPKCKSEEPLMSTALRKKMHQDLQLAGLSEGPQDVYLRARRRLAVHFDTPPDVLNEAQVRDY